MPNPPSAPTPSPAPQSTPESQISIRPWPGLDRLGVTQSLGGVVLSLIALFSSYDHLTFLSDTIPIPQQWGIPCIAASLALFLIDAQLATRARDRGADETTRERNLAGEERQRADRERNRAAEARERQAQDAERQSESLECLRQGALLSARVQLDPSDTNRAQLQTFLNLLSQTTPEDLDL